METKKKIMLFWSGGKNSALALHHLQLNSEYEVVGLITTINKETNTVPFHGIVDSILTNQTRMLNLPLQRIFLSKDSTNTEYLEKVRQILAVFAKRGISHIAFGDTSIQEIRDFKEKMLETLNLQAVFPLWGIKDSELREQIFSMGYKALVTSIDQSKLDKTFLNCEYNNDFIERLPVNTDNSAFHTFIIYGPGFKARVAFSKAVAIEEGPYLVSLVKEP